MWSHLPPERNVDKTRNRHRHQQHPPITNVIRDKRKHHVTNGKKQTGTQRCVHDPHRAREKFCSWWIMNKDINEEKEWWILSSWALQKLMVTQHESCHIVWNLSQANYEEENGEHLPWWREDLNEGEERLHHHGCEENRFSAKPS